MAQGTASEGIAKRRENVKINWTIVWSIIAAVVVLAIIGALFRTKVS